MAGAAEVGVWGSGTPRREFLHVSDLAGACRFLMEHYDSPEVINVGYGEDVTIRELAELICEVVGFAAYGPFRAWPGYKYSVEHSVYVAEGSRRRGVGRALVSGIVAEARTRGVHTIIGGVVSDNAASLRLHDALGFVAVGRIREVGFKFNRWLDLVFLQLVLDTPADPIDG